QFLEILLHRGRIENAQHPGTSPAALRHQVPFQGFDAVPIRFRQLAAERLQLTQGDVQVARVTESTQYYLERRPNPQKRCRQRRSELAQDGIQSASGDSQVV